VTVLHPVKLDPQGPFKRDPPPPHRLRDRLTPTHDVIVLCHLGVPRIERDRWTLTIDGLVERPLTLRFDDLARYPRTELTSVHQCCGSPLAPFEPTRRVCTVRWGASGSSTCSPIAGNSVKWLTRMTLVESRAPGPFTTRWYNDPVRDGSAAETGAATPVWSIDGQRAGPRDPMPTFLYLYVDDVDATYRRAMEAGAVSLEEPRDLPYGDRRGMVQDPDGNVWQIATPKR
jgi:DMSO/TMAO reductase YedYZ molybdopterin-dependent catalytic subunit